MQIPALQGPVLGLSEDAAAISPGYGPPQEPKVLKRIR